MRDAVRRLGGWGVGLFSVRGRGEVGGVGVVGRARKWGASAAHLRRRGASEGASEGTRVRTMSSVRGGRGGEEDGVGEGWSLRTSWSRGRRDRRGRSGEPSARPAPRPPPILERAHPAIAAPPSVRAPAGRLASTESIVEGVADASPSSARPAAPFDPPALAVGRGVGAHMEVIGGGWRRRSEAGVLPSGSSSWSSSSCAIEVAALVLVRRAVLRSTRL